MQLFPIFKQTLPLVLACCFAAGVAATPTQALSSIETVTSMYEAGNYNEVIALLENEVVNEPNNAAYHHLLAKSYGREAQRVNWLKAMDYARKTRDHLQIAVELEATNLVYLDDLKEYYREAPVFLGGNKRKAVELEARIRQIRQLSQI